MTEPQEFGLHSVRARYGFAVLVVLVAGVMMIGWLQIFDEPAVAPFLAAILVSGWYAGIGPVILTTLLSLAAYLVLFPNHFIELSVDFAARMAWFLAFAWLAASFGAGRRRAADRLEKARTELEERVTARTAALQRSEEYLHAAQELSHTGSWAWRIADDQLAWSAEGARILGLEPEVRTLTRAELMQVWHPADRERGERTLNEALRQKRGYAMRIRIVRPDGQVRFVRCTGRPVLGDDGEVVEFIGILMDLTRQVRASRRLRWARDEAAGARFVAILDERARLARDLHDTLLQGFTGVGLDLVAVTNRVHAPPELVTALREVIASAQETLESARRAIWNIRPNWPAGSDLVTTVRSIAEEGIRGTAVALEFATTGEPREGDTDTESAILRVVQEAIANAVQHSKASTVRVLLAFERGQLRLSIADDGEGFTVDPDLRTYHGHLGLIGMRERAHLVHGTLEVRSTPGRGTEIVLLVQLPGGARVTPFPPASVGRT